MKIKNYPRVYGWNMNLIKVFEQEEGKSDFSVYARSLIKMFRIITIIGFVVFPLGLLLQMPLLFAILPIMGIIAIVLVTRKKVTQPPIYVYEEGLVTWVFLKWTIEDKRGKKHDGKHIGGIALGWDTIDNVIPNDDGSVTLVCHVMAHDVRDTSTRIAEEQKTNLYPKNRDEFIEYVLSHCRHSALTPHKH